MALNGAADVEAQAAAAEQPGVPPVRGRSAARGRRCRGGHAGPRRAVPDRVRHTAGVAGVHEGAGRVGLGRA